MNLPKEIIRALNSNPKMFSGLLAERRKEFIEWLRENTPVVGQFLTYAQMLNCHGGRAYYSAYCIRERIRWDTLVSENGTDFKLSNNMTPFISRLVMEIDPSLKGMFRVKKGADYDQIVEPSIKPCA